MIKEMACPECGAGDGIEVFERDGLTVGDSVCCQCGFTIPEGVGLEECVSTEQSEGFHAWRCPYQRA